jgi:parallel beta-helix repeat protein
VSVLNNVFERNYLGGVFGTGSTSLSGSGQATTIHANRFTANGGDIDLVEISNVTITANKIDGTNGPGGEGVFFRRSGNISVVANNVSTHAGGGFAFWDSSSVIIRENVIRDNNGWGLYLYSSASFLVHDNDFLANWRQVRLDSSLGLVWNRNYPLGGNHWSDYTGSDVCGGAAQNLCPGPDGFGDTPYPVNATNEDRYPKMTPRGLPTVPPVASLLVQPIVGNVTTTFAANASFSWDLNEPSSGLEFRWDWESDGRWDTDWTEESVSLHRYDLPGVYSLHVQVRDHENMTDDASALVVVVRFEPKPEPSSAITIILVAAGIGAISTASGCTFVVTRRRRRMKPREDVVDDRDRRI